MDDGGIGGFGSDGGRGNKEEECARNRKMAKEGRAMRKNYIGAVTPAHSQITTTWRIN